ncbi:MAG: retroviral-like aspartic protease family protein [Rhizomicrobium sp.]|jgi:predicted aspartyl protease
MIVRATGVFRAVICACLASGIATARADDCKLGRIAEMDLTESQDSMSVPVSIEGTQSSMLVDTGASITALDPQATAALNIITHRIYQGQFFTAGGKGFQEMAVIHSLGLGQSTASNVKTLVWPEPMFAPHGPAGTLGVDFLRNYDVDIDFANHRLGLFSQDHCPGKVVYWQADAVAVIPVHVTNSGQIVVPVKLDGHQLYALLDTGSFNTTLTLEAAQNYFGLKPGSPDMVPAGEFHGVSNVPAYRHTFKTLELEGIAMANPSVYIWEDIEKYGMASSAPETGSRLNDSSNAEWVTDITLGYHQLRNLHMYIAFKEQKLYVTASSPAPAGAAQTGPAAGTSATPPTQPAPGTTPPH